MANKNDEVDGDEDGDMPLFSEDFLPSEAIADGDALKSALDGMRLAANAANFQFSVLRVRGAKGFGRKITLRLIPDDLEERMRSQWQALAPKMGLPLDTFGSKVMIKDRPYAVSGVMVQRSGALMVRIEDMRGNSYLVAPGRILLALQGAA